MKKKVITKKLEPLAEEAKLNAKIYGKEGLDKFIDNVLKKQEFKDEVDKLQPMGLSVSKGMTKQQLNDFYNQAINKPMQAK